MTSNYSTVEETRCYVHILVNSCLFWQPKRPVLNRSCRYYCCLRTASTALKDENCSSQYRFL